MRGPAIIQTSDLLVAGCVIITRCVKLDILKVCFNMVIVIMFKLSG